MKYMLMMNTPRGDGSYEIFSWAPEAVKAHGDYWRALNEGLQEAGELVAVEALSPPARARRVRAGQGGQPITDGVFPETKEFLAGYWIIDVDSPERAQAIAAHASAAPGPDGKPLNMAIEVREVMSLANPDQP